MKKIPALLMAVCLLFTLAACGSSSPAETTPATETAAATETTAATETAATEAAATAEASESGDAVEQTYTVTCEDLTMTVTATRFEDKTEEWDNGATGCYVVNNDFAIMAIREDNSSISGDPDLETYADGLIQVNDFGCEVEYHGDIPYFTYADDDAGFTYLVSVYRGSESYWFLQTYGATEDFSTLEPQIWDILTTVSIA